MSDVLYYCRQIPAAMLPLRVYGLQGLLSFGIRMPNLKGSYRERRVFRRKIIG